MKVQNRMAGLARHTRLSCGKKMKTDMLSAFASYDGIVFI
jgi:hypothetical protein